MAAREILRDTLVRQQRTLGHDDAGALSTAHALAWAHQDAGDNAAAQVVLRDTLARRRRTLGHEHAAP